MRRQLQKLLAPLAEWSVASQQAGMATFAARKGEVVEKTSEAHRGAAKGVINVSEPLRHA